jgi:hypothetical protein
LPVFYQCRGLPSPTWKSPLGWRSWDRASWYNYERNPTRCNYTRTGSLIIPRQLYMFRAMFSPIIRNILLYLQYLVVFTQVAAGWCLGWVGNVSINQNTSW